jgi:hypothetical protein
MDDQTENITLATPTKTEPAIHGAVEAPAKPLEPQIINGVKVYPPSYIPTKAVLHLPKKLLVSMEIEHIEGIHIACFLGITVFLFIGMWKRPDLR